jgi:opacity protein-like surface antigen
MRTTRASLRIIFFSTVLFFISLAPAALAQDQIGRWGIGIRAGPSFLTQGFASASNSDPTGLIVGGNLLYRYDNLLSFGLNFERESHRVETLEVNRIRTISLLPFIEIRPFRFQALLPYASFGVGVNINSFGLSQTLQRQPCGIPIGTILLVAPKCTVDQEYTFAVKIGVGADYFVTEHLSVNAEAGWKHNSGRVQIITSDGDITVNPAYFDSSVFSLLLGLRYYF